MITLMMFIGIVLNADSTGLVDNGSFEIVKNGIPVGWKLAEGNGKTAPGLGIAKSNCITVFQGKSHVNWWKSRLDLKSRELYCLSFYCKLIKGSGGNGCIVSGPLGMNRDFHPGEEWKRYSFVFPVSASGGGVQDLRLGIWEMNAEVAFDDVSILPVNVFYKRVNGFALGDGEKLSGSKYSFKTGLSGFLSAYSRPLKDFRCGFNSTRWCFSPGDFVLYHHQAGREEFKSGSVGVRIGYYRGGVLKIQARKAGSDGSRGSRGSGGTDGTGSTGSSRGSRGSGGSGGSRGTGGLPGSRGSDGSGGSRSLPGSRSSAGLSSGSKRRWIDVGLIKALEAKRFKLPASLFPARAIEVRLMQPEKPSGSFQVYSYDFEGELKEDTSLYETGATSTLIPGKEDKNISVTIKGVGDLFPGGKNFVDLDIKGSPGTEGIARVKLNRVYPGGKDGDGEAAWTERFKISDTGLKSLRIKYFLRSAGSQELCILIKRKDGKELYNAKLPFSVPPLLASDYGYLVPDEQTGLGLWWCTSTEKIGRRRQLPSTNRAIAIEAAGNEEEAFQLVFRPERNLKQVRIKFMAPGGSSIKSGKRTGLRKHLLANGLRKHLLTNGLRKSMIKTRVREVSYVNLKEPTDYSGCTGLWPDPLAPHDKAIDIPAGTNQPFWLSVRIRKDTPPGNYKLSAVVEEQGRKRAEIPVTLHVFNFSLPEKHSIHTAFGFSISLASKYHKVTKPADKRKLFDCYMKDFRDHRISTYDFAPFDPIRVSFPGRVGKGDSGKVKVDFAAWDKQARKYLDDYNFDGFRLRLNCLGGGTFHSRRYGKIGKYKQGSKEYRALFKDYGSQVEDHLRANGWLDKAYVYWFDEPAQKDYKFVEEGMNEIHMAAPGLRRMLTEEPNKELGGFVDIWCPVLQNAVPEKIADRIQAGEKVWWYVCCSPKAPYLGLFIDHPATDLRVWLWLSWKWSVTGILVWESNYWTSPCAYPGKLQDPWSDPMSYRSGYGLPPGYVGYWGNGDGRFLYPPRELDKTLISGPVDTIRWEMLREGIEDYEYLAMLKKLVTEAEKKGIKTKNYKRLLEVPSEIIEDGKNYTRKSRPIFARRHEIGSAVSVLRKKLSSLKR